MNHIDACLANISLSSEDETCLSQIGAIDQQILISYASSCNENKFRAKSGPLPIPRQFQAKSDPLPIPGQSSYSNRRRDLELDQIKQMYDYSTWKMYNRIANCRKYQPDCFDKTSFKDVTQENVRNDRNESTRLCPEGSRIISKYQTHSSVENDSEEDDIFYLEIE